MKLGKENLSEMQRRYLEIIKSDPSTRTLARAIWEFVSHDPIVTGEEDLHPDWVQVFEEKKDGISRYLGQDAFNTLVERLTPFIPFERSLTDLEPDKLTITFLLGAGASKPAPSSIPTVKELLPHLLERARRLDRDDVTKLADFCEGKKIDNIEDLLTAAQLATFCSKNPFILGLLNYLLYRRESEVPEEEFIYEETRGFPSRRRIRHSIESSADLSSVAFLQDTLQVLFGLLASTMLPSQPNRAHESIANYSLSHPKTTIVTTNYDCCMDLALGAVSYLFNYSIDFDNSQTHRAVGTEGSNLIKMHGSLNWYYCETCQEVQLVDITESIRRHMNDEAPYCVIGICRRCGGQRRGLLLPPLAMKFDVAPPLTPLLSAAETAFEKADLIVVVGFSFAEADLYISRMLSKAMQTSNNQKLVIVDPDSGVIKRVRRKFKASIPNFDVNRILRMTGDCATLLPQFLSGELHKNASRSKAEVTRERKDKNGRR